MTVEMIFEDHPHKGVFYNEHDRWKALREAAARDHDLKYKFVFEDESLAKVISDAIGREFLPESIVNTRDQPNNSHIRLEHEDYQGFARIIKTRTSSGIVYRLFEPVD